MTLFAVNSQYSAVLVFLLMREALRLALKLRRGTTCEELSFYEVGHALDIK